MERIPNQIDEPMMFLMWSSDEFIPATAILGVGMFTGYLTISILVAWVAVKFYRRKRDGNHRGFLLHWAYWTGIVNGAAGGKAFSVKNPYLRKFIP